MIVARDIALDAGAVDSSFDDLRAEVYVRIRRILEGAGIPLAKIAVSFEYDQPRLLVHLRGPTITPAVRQALGVRVLDALHASGRAFAQIDVSYDDVAP